jgi:putative nucleotidyltransferase with HDIG domain
MFRQIVKAMSLLCELKDPYTARHQRRVANLSYAIGQEMGLSREDNRGVQVAAVIHDIGKITVPSDILTKPAKLNATEYNLIKSHAKTAYKVLKILKFPWPVAQIVLQHHERINGSGYPNGLSGRDISIQAKIISVADVVEAMVSHRPYRAGLGIDKALEEIKGNSNILYDEDTVDACLRLFSTNKFQFE